MKLISTNWQSHPVTLKQAVRHGLAPDGGLWMFPELPKLPAELLDKSNQISLPEAAFLVTRQFLGSQVPDEDLKDIIKSSLNFDIPIQKLSSDLSVLELFHGPTLAFKDVGARFMAQLISYFLQKEESEVTVLVATSGDTGSAAAHAFTGIPGVKVVLLYPKNGVSAIQERFLTTAGSQVKALRVNGSFDDCQRLVKEAFVDPELIQRVHLISANSINVARLIAQTVYFAWAFLLSPQHPQLTFSVPSGNMGNLTAGLMMRRMGLPISKMIVACNVNDPVPEYLRTGFFKPRPSVSTLSNAMDIGNPSNFARMQYLFDGDLAKMREAVTGYSFSDEQTAKIIKKIWQEHRYQIDPHTAVALLGAESYRKENPDCSHIVALGTAHPVKFKDEVERIIGADLDLPKQVKKIFNKEMVYRDVEAELRGLKEVLLG